MLTLLTRAQCGLCDHAAEALRDLGLPFETIDVDQDSRLLALYNEAIPVILDADREVIRAPITKDGLKSALRDINLSTGR